MSTGLRLRGTAETAILTFVQSLEIFHKGIGDLCAVVVGDSCRRALNILHQAVEVVARVRNADDADGGAIPEFSGIKFGDRHVETGAQPIFQATHDLAPVFNGLGSFDVEFERKESDHAVVGRWPLVVGRQLDSSHDSIRW